jgi:hypothetical protein
MWVIADSPALSDNAGKAEKKAIKGWLVDGVPCIQRVNLCMTVWGILPCIYKIYTLGLFHGLLKT